MRRKLPIIRPDSAGQTLVGLRKSLDRHRSDPLTGYREFEARFAELAGVGDCILFPRANAALHAALSGLGIRPGATIAVPTLTCTSVPLQLQRAGYRPVPIDVRESDGTIDPHKLHLLDRHRPSAILATHILGNPAPLEAIGPWADAHDVCLIEDCAHAIGTQFKGRKIGTFGRAGIVSFASFKPISMNGGGALITDDPDLADAARERQQRFEPEPFPRHLLKTGSQAVLRLGTSAPVYDWVGAFLWQRLFESSNGLAAYKTYIRPFLKKGADSETPRMPHPAAVESALRALDRFPAALKRRRQQMAQFQLAFPRNQAARRLFISDPGGESACQYLYIKSNDRDRDIARLNRAGIGAVRPSSMYWDFPDAREEEVRIGRKLDETLIMLPWYDDLGEDEVLRIARAVAALP